MKTFKYPHCVISNDIIYVSNNKISCRPASETCFENVVITIEDNGVMDICGDEVKYSFNFHDEKLSNLDEIPHNCKIKHNSGVKLFGFYLIKPYDYVSAGWYELKERKQKRIILNKYKLEII